MGGCNRYGKCQDSVTSNEEDIPKSDVSECAAKPSHTPAGGSRRHRVAPKRATQVWRHMRDKGLIMAPLVLVMGAARPLPPSIHPSIQPSWR